MAITSFRQTPEQAMGDLSRNMFGARMQIAQKEAYENATSDEERERAHQLAEFIRAATGNQAGYGANNTLEEARARYAQEYPAAQWISEAEVQEQRQESLEGKNVANASFAEGQARLNDSQARSHANLLVQAKQDWARADALEQQAMAILNNNPNATEEEKAQAQSQLVMANLAKQTASEQARQIRERASRLGIDLSGYGSDNTLSEAETNIGFELDKAIRNMFVDQYADNSAIYYNRKYNEYRNEGLSKRHARERATADAEEYRAKRMQAARDLFRNIGVSGGQITDDGLSLSHVMYEEGDPEAGALWERSYASPGANWVAEQNRLDADLTHARNEESADNNLARTQALALFNNNIDSINQEIAHERTKEKMTHAANLNWFNTEAQMRLQSVLTEDAAGKDFIRKVQLLGIEQEGDLKKETIKQAMQNAQTQQAYLRYRAMGYSEEEAWLLAMKYSLGRNSQRNATSKEEKEKGLSQKQSEQNNRFRNYLRRIGEAREAGDKKTAQRWINEAEDFIQGDEGLVVDPDTLQEFKKKLEEEKYAISDEAEKSEHRKLSSGSSTDRPTAGKSMFDYTKSGVLDYTKQGAQKEA